MKRFRLYALPVREETIEKAQSERFSRICTDYILIYSAKQIRGGVQVKIDDLHLLTTEEADWLRDCNLLLLTEEGRRKRAATLENVSKKLDAVERFLREAQVGGEILRCGQNDTEDGTGNPFHTGEK